MKYLSECDLLIYDLHSSNYDDIDTLYKMIDKYGNSFEEEKVIIIISSLMSWMDTPPKKVEINKDGTVAGQENKEDGDGGDGGDDGDKGDDNQDPLSDQQDNDDDQDEQPKKKA